MGDFDQQEDAKSGSKKKGKGSLPPGKVAGTDNYGDGGAGVTAPIPGKTSGTAHLPDGTNGNSAGTLDAKGDQNGNANGNTPGKNTNGQATKGDEGKDKNGAAAGGGGSGTAKTIDADHGGGPVAANGKQPGKGSGKGGADPTKKDAQGKGKGPAAPKNALAGNEGKDKGGAPLVDAKPAAPPQSVDIPQVASIPTFQLDPPRHNKALSDKWLKETGRTVEQHFQQIQQALTELQSDVQAKQTELLSQQDQAITKVTADVSSKVESFKSSLITPGRARVEAAYGGLTKSFEANEKKALADIAKHKETGKAQITTAKQTNSTQLSTKFATAKGIVDQTVAKNVPIAAQSIKQWAGGIPQWVKSAKDQAKTATEAVSKNYDPNKGNTSSLSAALIALEEDVKKNHTIKHGEKLGKQYEASLMTWGKDTDKKADEVVRNALDSSKLEFEMALDISTKSSTKSIDEATTGATTQLDTNETTAKKAVSDAKTNGIKRFETEKKGALDAADKAGQELSDNATNSGTELTDRIKKKAAEDSKTYAAIVADLQKQLKKGGPQKFEQVQPKIQASRDAMLKAHATNMTELDKLVTEGTSSLGATLQKQREIYNQAITDREEGARKVETEVNKEIGKGAESMGSSLTGLATTFQTTSTKEVAKLDAAIAAFNQNADTATKDFGNKITQHLEGERNKLEQNLKDNLQPAQIKADVEPDTAGEVAAKKKSLSTDAGGLRDAMDGWGTDENKIYGILRKASYGEITYLEAVYDDHYSWRAKNGKTPLRYDFDDEMSGNELKIAMSYLNHDRTTAIKLELADSIGFWNDDESRIEEVLRSCNEDEIKFLNTDADAKKTVVDVKDHLGGCDLDVMTTLLDTSVEKEDRASKADAIRLFDSMEGLGTDEAKMKKILEGAQTPEERAKLRANFNAYATSKGWSGGDGGAKGEEDDALARAIKDDTSGGDQAVFLTLAKTERNDEDVKVAKLYQGADGAGTDEDAIFDALDDEAYAKAWKEAKTPEEKKKLEDARKARLDQKLDKMSGGDFKTAQGLIDSEMSKSPVTYQEFLDNKHTDGRPLTADEIKGIKNGDNLEWVVAQRKLQTGQAEPELMLAYACWGVVGTDEDTIKKVISNGGEPKSIKEIEGIKEAFFRVWGKKLMSHNEMLEPKKGEPTGVLCDELSGKDWNKVRQLMCGKPETAEQLKFMTDLQGKYATSGLIGGHLMAVGEAIGFTDAKTTAEKSQERFDNYYQQNFSKNPTASLQSAQGERLEQLGEYLTQDYEAYSAALNSLVDGVVTALEVIGGVIITVVTAGTASPVLAAVIANLVLSAGTITFKYAALGDQYGAAELATDVVKAVGTAAFAGLGEVKALNGLTEKVGAATAGKVQKLAQLADQAASKAGVKLGEKGLEMGPKAVEKLTKIVAAGTKNVIIGTGQEVYNTLTDEKTYSKKLGDVLWGEDSLGARILKGIPKEFAEGAVTQWINESAGTSNKDNAGHSTGPKSNALTNAIAEMGGNTAGFFVYVDNYKDAEHFWMELLKSNAQKGIGGAMNGYAMHKTRAKKLGRDFITGDMGVAGLEEMLKSMDAHEVQDLAKFVEKYGGDKAQQLPEAFKQYLDKKPAAGTTASTTTTAAKTTTNADGNTQTDPVSTEPSTSKKKDDEKPVTPVVAKDNEEKKPATTTTTEDEKKKTTTTPVAAEDEPKKTTTPPVVDQDEQKKKATSTLEDEEQKKTAAPIQTEDEKKKAVAPVLDEDEKKKVVAPIVDEEEKKKSSPPVKDEEEKKSTSKPEEESDLELKQKKKQSEEDEKKKQAGQQLSEKQEEELRKKAARADRIEEQKEEKGHAGIEVHSHFLGNVEPTQFRKVMAESGMLEMAPGDTTTWEPVLREIAALEKKEGFAHKYKTKEDGSHEVDPKTKLPVIEERGATGDAIAQAKAALAKIEEQKKQLANPKLSDEDRQKIKDKIYRDARSAAEKALRASDETDFNSSYEVRDELIKKFYGEKDRKEALIKAGVDPKAAETAGVFEASDAYRKYFEEQGRPDVVKRIDDAVAAKKKLDDPAEMERLNQPENKAELKRLQDAVKSGSGVKEQFAYDRFAKDTVLRLVQDNLDYTEQSNSAKKLSERFDPQQMDQIKRQLIAEHPELKDKIEAFQLKHLTMLNTAQFGVRGNKDDGVDTSDIPGGQKGTRKAAADKGTEAEEQKSFESAVKGVVEQTRRKDVVGVDIAGAETFTFDEKGAERFGYLYEELRKEAKIRGEPIVLRPHVGEGANDTESGKHYGRDTDRQMDDGQLSHYKRAKDNLDALLGTLEGIAAKKGQDGKLPPDVIVRFGHATHATPEQAARMAKLGIIAEVNLSSNVETGSASQKKPKSGTEDNQRGPDEQFPRKNTAQDRGGNLEDHSLANLILNDVPIILSTDGHAVMSTTMKREYELAGKTIDKILASKQSIPLTEAQAKALGINPKKLQPDQDGVVHVKLKDIPEDKRGAIVKKFEDAKHKFYEDANDYYDKRPKKGGGDEGGGGPGPAPAGEGPDAAKHADTKKKLDHLDELKAQLDSPDAAVRAKAQEDLSRLASDPQWADALKVKDLFKLAVAHQEHTEEKGIGPDNDLVSNNIPAILEEQKKARLGKNPELQAKREKFERAMALAVLKEGSPVRKAVDGELDKLCAKALDYIKKTRSEEERSSAISNLGTDKKKGYGGAVGKDEAVMMDILERGNIRERMLALSKFMEMIGKDSMSAGGRQRIEEAGFSEGGDAGDKPVYTKEMAEKLLERARQYQEANPNAKDTDKDVASMFKPTKDEKFGQHHDYADAKGQEMDTKLPAMLAEKVNEFLGRQAAKDRMVEKGENNPLARTQMTVREAMEKGLGLSQREIAAAGGLDAPLNWVVGQTANIVDPNARFIREAKENSMPLKAGISGTTYRWMQVVDLLGGDPQLARLAAIASLQAADAHSFHEIATAAKGFGVDYNSSTPYANTGLPQPLLEKLAADSGTSLDELNGTKPDAKPAQ